MARRQGGTLSGFTPLSTPNAPTGLSVSTSIGSASVSFTAPTDTGDGAVTSYIVTAVNESTGASTGVTGSASPITISPGGGTFKIRAQAVNGFGPGRLSEFSTGNAIFSGAALYAVGFNNAGRLGDGTVINRSSPVQIGALTDWSQVSAGESHTASIKSDNTLWTWGNGAFGKLGQFFNYNKSSPVQVGALTNWSQVSAGQTFTLAVKTDGTLWSWGYNDYGQVGDGTRISRSSPVQIGSLTTWYEVSAGGKHSLAVKTDGTLWAWGKNASGQLGLNISEITHRSSPVQVGALTNWYQIASGENTSAAVKTDGTMWTWGFNNSGQLGLGDTSNRSSPVQVGALATWSQVSASTANMIAVKTDGTMWTWGNNDTGQIGVNDTTVMRSTPIQVGALTTWSKVSSGNFFMSAVKTDGTWWTWGYNGRGQLGDNTTASKSSPIQVGGLTAWLEVSSGENQTIALLGVV